LITMCCSSWRECLQVILDKILTTRRARDTVLSRSAAGSLPAGRAPQNPHAILEIDSCFETGERVRTPDKGLDL
jgi:hypothetical protein